MSKHYYLVPNLNEAMNGLCHSERSEESRCFVPQHDKMTKSKSIIDPRKYFISIGVDRKRMLENSCKYRFKLHIFYFTFIRVIYF